MPSALHSGERAEEGPTDLAGAVTSVPTAGLAVGRGGLAAPGVAVLALAAEPRASVGGSAARALTTPLLGENDDESEIVHFEPPSLTIRIVRIGANARYGKGAAGSKDAVTTR